MHFLIVFPGINAFPKFGCHEKGLNCTVEVASGSLVAQTCEFLVSLDAVAQLDVFDILINGVNLVLE